MPTPPEERQSVWRWALEEGAAAMVGIVTRAASPGRKALEASARDIREAKDEWTP